MSYLANTSANRYLGKYLLLDLLGYGGMGQVWRAQDSFGNIVAIKMLNGSQGATPDQIRRFQREAEVMTKLCHRNICRIFEVGTIDGLPYIVLEYISGAALAEVLMHPSVTTPNSTQPSCEVTVIIRTILEEKSKSRDATENDAPESATKPTSSLVLPLQQTLALVDKICDAVQAAHETGVLHRDIKPGNIMLREDGDPVVMDFGLAKLERGKDSEDDSLSITGQIFGTIDYMAPEQALSSKDIDERADVYSLGAVFYQMVTGQKHFQTTGNLLQDAQQLQTHIPPRPHLINKAIETDLEVILLKALRADPAERYRNVRALWEDVRRYRDGEVILAKEPTIGHIVAKWIKRNRKLAWVILSATAALLLGAVISFININQRRIEAEQSRLEAVQLRQVAETSLQLARQNEARALAAEEKAKAALDQVSAQKVKIEKAAEENKALLAQYEAEQRAKGEALKKVDRIEKDNRSSDALAKSNAALLFVEAQKSMRTAKFPQALEQITQAVKIEPELIGAWLLKAQLHAGLFDLDKCSESLQQTYRLKRAPDYFDTTIKSYFEVTSVLRDSRQDRELQLALAQMLHLSSDESDRLVGQYLRENDPAQK